MSGVLAEETQWFGGLRAGGRSHLEVSSSHVWQLMVPAMGPQLVLLTGTTLLGFSRLPNFLSVSQPWSSQTLHGSSGSKSEGLVNKVEAALTEDLTSEATHCHVHCIPLLHTTHCHVHCIPASPRPD